MTASTIPGLDQAPTRHARVLAWVRQVAWLTTPDRVVWCDGSDDEWRCLTTQLVRAGTLVRLRQKPNSFWCAGDPSDVAPVERSTFLCSERESDAGPTNNWMAPGEMKRLMTGLYRGCMRGRTMYVVPFCLGPLSAEEPMLGVEITDSAYVVVSMQIMTRTGSDVLARLGDDAGFLPCLHSVGAPLEPGQADVPWPCNDIRYLAHFPETREVWSFGSGHGDNALLGTKCCALRIASVIAREEGWLAEHMVILKVITPQQAVHYVAAAGGRTDLAMLASTIPGWTVETIGDDIAWLRFGDDGRLHAVNPERGFSGVGPGTSWHTNPNTMHALAKGNSLFTNTALTDDGDIWWEGMSTPPGHLTSWRNQDWWPAADGGPAAHPGARYTTPITQCPVLAPEWDDPNGVPISAILFGGRRATTAPLVAQARDWRHGTFLGAVLATETSTAPGGPAGAVHRDPMSMGPFLGYHVGDYLQHWLDVGDRADAAKLPEIFTVNWFRRDRDGQLLWPGFSANTRILKWVIERVEGTGTAFDTPVGWVPTAAALDLGGLDAPTEHVNAALAVHPDEWRAELPLVAEWLDTIGDKLPAPLSEELGTLTRRLG
ncbi:MAG TPA: phosphoenolpyruvate carboxykinase (GTP) [Actinophytocola sp.]|jgi:phosphoenolpyruvate carboxykinase (GTP)|uniref:phosphoenolpyruvate carboxykinase (GTP) n=1 Tax=Actinophytocola sp. TaxID=1872138 RepID=UPI002E081F97|nr:phosphoenolpyruvate carboxykinase (GTP) [Actinophytocola sp.]